MAWPIVSAENLEANKNANSLFAVENSTASLDFHEPELS
jgi:hypothetical protein